METVCICEECKGTGRTKDPENWWCNACDGAGMVFTKEREDPHIRGSFPPEVDENPGLLDKD